MRVLCLHVVHVVERSIHNRAAAAPFPPAASVSPSCAARFSSVKLLCSIFPWNAPQATPPVQPQLGYGAAFL
jgi:hypothetical protein